MMTVEQQNLAHRAVSALEGIQKAIVEFRNDFLDAHGMRDVKPRRFDVGHSSLLSRFANRQPEHRQWTAILTLLDALDTVYLTTDNTYGGLDKLVAEKLQNVKGQFPKEQ